MEWQTSVVVKWLELGLRILDVSSSNLSPLMEYTNSVSSVHCKSRSFRSALIETNDISLFVGLNSLDLFVTHSVILRCIIWEIGSVLNNNNNWLFRQSIQLAEVAELIDDKSPYYKYTPASVLENEHSKLYWIRSKLTDKTVPFNRPDLTFMNKKTKKTFLIDIAVPTNKTSTENWRMKYVLCGSERQHKWSR